MVYTTKESLILENKWVSIAISAVDATVQQIIDQQTGCNICAEPTAFFAAVGADKQTQFPPKKLTLAEDILTVQTELGDFSVRIDAQEAWFTFELLTTLPKGVYKVRLAHAKYTYDLQSENACSAVGIALTYWANPCFYPDGKDKETMAEVTAHLKDVGAKYALIIAPHQLHRQLIKDVSLAIDRKTGIVSPHGGAWSRESVLNMGNSFIIEDAEEEFVLSRIEFFKKLGVDQIDFHKGLKTFCQGDFRYVHYRDDADFKARITDVLEKNGMTAGLHTYSCYIDFDCSGILSDPKWQKDLSVLQIFTLAEDISESAAFLPTAESTDAVPEDYGFFDHNTPYVLVGREIMEIEKAPGGFRIRQRGVAGTQAACHGKGAGIARLEGYYWGFVPVMGSELFFEIARNTAKTFCAGGFKTIYLDALDGITKHCDTKNEAWFYMAAFVTELIANCEYAPMLEYSTICPSLWAGRGRFGAYDTPSRGYKEWNRMHAQKNRVFLDRYATATLGWYDFYPLQDKYPGNVHTKYHHADAVHHMGSLLLMNNYNVVFNGTSKENLERIPALARNIAIYKRYDQLRKAQYFDESVLSAARSGKYEYHLTQMADGEFTLVEKDFQIRKLYDLAADERNVADFENPFGEQTPFVRIEALLSGDGTESVTLLPLDPEQPIERQTTEKVFDQEMDLSGQLANRVSVCGNGKPGSAVAIRMDCGTIGEPGKLEFFIDTDYTGWREFVLVESDNGQRSDLPFDQWDGDSNLHSYSIFRSQFHHDRFKRIWVTTTAEAEGVKMTSVTACRHCFAEMEEPTVQIGSTAVTFHCRLRSTDFIEFDGKSATMIDRYGNETKIAFTGSLTAPGGKFAARLHTDNSEDLPLRAQLTLGFTGNTIG